MSALTPDWIARQAEEQAALDALPLAERPAALLKKRAQQSPENLMAQWWKGGSLPDDLNLKDKAFAFGDLAPERNGRLDIFYARGAIDYRPAISHVMLCASPPMIEPTMKMAMAMMKRPLRPMRSPSFPYTGRVMVEARM